MNSDLLFHGKPKMLAQIMSPFLLAGMMLTACGCDRSSHLTFNGQPISRISIPAGFTHQLPDDSDRFALRLDSSDGIYISIVSMRHADEGAGTDYARVEEMFLSPRGDYMAEREYISPESGRSWLRRTRTGDRGTVAEYLMSNELLWVWVVFDVPRSGKIDQEVFLESIEF